MSSIGKVLALDYGKSKIGAAISDEGQTVVFGRGFIDCKKSLKGFFEQIRTWRKDDNINTIVIGLPLDENGRETLQTRRIRNFAKKLEHFLKSIKLTASVVFEDESFTSFEANERLVELGFEAKKSKKHEDELAAVLILQRYLKRKQ